MQLLPASHEGSPNADILLASCTIDFDKPRGSNDYSAVSYPAGGHVVALELPHDDHTLNLSVVALLFASIEKTCLQRGINHLWIALVYDDWMKNFLEKAGFEPCRCSKDVVAINASQGSMRFCKSPDNYQYVQQVTKQEFATQRTASAEDGEVIGRGRNIGQGNLERIVGRKRTAISPPGNDVRAKRRVELPYLKEEDHFRLDTQLVRRNSSSAVSHNSVSVTHRVDYLMSYEF